MSAHPVLLLFAASAVVAGALAARRRSAPSPVEPYPTPPLVQRPAPGPA